MVQEGQISIEQVNYMGNQPKPPHNDPHSNTLNPSWRNHSNFSWGSNQGNQGQWNNNNFQNNRKPQQPPQRQPPYPQPSNNSPQTPLKQSDYLEDALAKLTINCNTFIDETRSNLKNQGEALKKVEVQVGDLAKQAVNVVMVEEAPTQGEKVEAEIIPSPPPPKPKSASEKPKPLSKFLEVFA
ncbi:hypothetical protein PIB30_099697 [Stylosanthes scabra]|uniref:Uncharacterized protein n=1 Tax=Stylosanthes scabra TaxID=79078 RepID=A0ABU6UWK5_9FABA|nr:hypothetical protein [Stylosanthes scabra]